MFKKAIHFFNGTDKSGRMFKAFIGTIQSERASKLVEFKYWVGRLSDNNAGLFAKEVSGMCAGFGFPMHWCRSIPNQANTTPAEREMYLATCLAVYQSWHNRPMFKLIASMHGPEDDQAANEFLEQLFLLLLESGFIIFPGRLLFATKEERRKIIRKTLFRAMHEADALVTALAHEVEYLQKKTLTS